MKLTLFILLYSHYRFTDNTNRLHSWSMLSTGCSNEAHHIAKQFDWDSTRRWEKENRKRIALPVIQILDTCNEICNRQLFVISCAYYKSSRVLVAMNCARAKWELQQKHSQRKNTEFHRNVTIFTTQFQRHMDCIRWIDADAMLFEYIYQLRLPM